MADRQRYEVKYWKLTEPSRHYEECHDLDTADEFARKAEANGYLTTIRPKQHDPNEDTIPRRMLKLLLEGLKEKLDD